MKIGDYGVVIFNKDGRFLHPDLENKVGFYDDDFTNDNEESYAIVYFDELFEGYELIPHTLLERVEIGSVQVQKFIKEYPKLAAQLGIAQDKISN